MTSKGSKADEDSVVPGLEEFMKAMHKQGAGAAIVEELGGLNIPIPPVYTDDEIKRIEKPDIQEPRKYTAEEVQAANSPDSIGIKGESINMQIDIVPIDALYDLYVSKYEEFGQKVSHFEAYFDQARAAIVFIVYFEEGHWEVGE